MKAVHSYAMYFQANFGAVQPRSCDILRNIGIRRWIE